jgi:hypothetical protein
VKIPITSIISVRGFVAYPDKDKPKSETKPSITYNENGVEIKVKQQNNG